MCSCFVDVVLLFVFDVIFRSVVAMSSSFFECFFGVVDFIVYVFEGMYMFNFGEFEFLKFIYDDFNVVCVIVYDDFDDDCVILNL